VALDYITFLKRISRNSRGAKAQNQEVLKLQSYFVSEAEYGAQKILLSLNGDLPRKFVQFGV
jgi:hypothetical protein